MAHFEVVSKYKDCGINLPIRATAHSAGYDFEAAEDIVIPPYKEHIDKMNIYMESIGSMTDLDCMADITSYLKAKPTLISTGVKCYLADDEYLELAARSSLPLKAWLILANGEGIIDADYVDNEANEGDVCFQYINLSPFSILIRKGDKIGQGIIHKFSTIENDNATGIRTGGFGSTNE